MLNRAGGAAVSRGAVLLVGLVAVPALLAGLALLWPGPSIAEDLRDRSVAALAAAGIPGVEVTVSGRDVVLAGVPGGGAGAASDVVGAVAGVRTVTVPAGSRTTGDSAQPPLSQPPRSQPAVAAPAGSARVAADVAALVDAAPITFPADSAELAGSAEGTVVRLAEILRAGPDVSVELVGHAADTPGAPATAQTLSEDRAAVVPER